MSTSAVALDTHFASSFQPMIVPAPAPALAPWVEAPVAPGWASWADRLEVQLQRSAAELRSRGRRARRLTVTLYFADGRVRRRTLALPRATDDAAAMRPAALGLLRLLVDRHPKALSRVGLELGRLVEGANQPIRFERYLARRRSPVRRLLSWLGLARR